MRCVNFTGRKVRASGSLPEGQRFKSTFLTTNHNKYKMQKKNPFYSIWALFEYKEQKNLEILKKKININLKGPNFPIHMTISAGFFGSKKKIIKKINSIIKKTNKFFIKVNDYGCKNKKFQSLYVNVKINHNILLIKKNIDTLFNCKTNSFFPHISLFYGRKNYIEKKKIISDLPKLKKKIKITSLCLALNNEKKLEWKIIKKFKI